MNPEQLAARAAATYYAKLIAQAEREGNHLALAGLESQKEATLLIFERGYLECIAELLDHPTPSAGSQQQ